MTIENQPSTSALPLPPGKSGLPWIGETISFLKLLMPAFHGKALMNYVTTMTEITDRYLTKWEQIGNLTWFSELKNLTFEIASVLLIGTDTPITIDSLKQMTYLDRVLREVERMYPPVGGGFRGVVEEFEFNGYRVPKGWQVLYRIPEAHFDETVYPMPTTFDPDRFNPDRSDYKASDYTFVTYGGGARICIGMAFAQMELKIIAAMLLRRNSWELLPNQNLTLDPIPTLHPRDGLKVKFQKLS